MNMFNLFYVWTFILLFHWELLNALFFSFIDHRKLDENLALGCDCYLYETLLVVKATISGGQCGTPATLLGVVFGNANKSLPMYFETQPLSDFLCCECLCQIIWRYGIIMITTLFWDVLKCLLNHLILSFIKYLMCFDEYTLHLNKPILKFVSSVK